MLSRLWIGFHEHPPAISRVSDALDKPRGCKPIQHVRDRPGRQLQPPGQLSSRQRAIHDDFVHTPKVGGSDTCFMRDHFVHCLDSREPRRQLANDDVDWVG
nr:hypothetical protein [Pseudonocardia sp. EC080610-09]